MSRLLRFAAAGLVFSAAVGDSLLAQWPEVKTRNVPMTRDGQPNLSAPAPKMADRKTPSLAGVWKTVKAPCLDEIGCGDASEGVPVGFVDVSATRLEEWESGRPGGLPYLPWAKAIFEQRASGLGKGDSTTRCLPMSSVRQWTSFHPQKILQNEEALVILDEYMVQYRQIFLDGRPLPKANDYPHFKGYSVGRWEGDTLVVETVGFKDQMWLDGKGNFMTEDARTTERIRRPDFGHLEVQITVTDPKAFSAPWTVTRYLTIALDTELHEYVCNENERDAAHMVGQ